MITILPTFTPVSKLKAFPHGMHLMSLDSIIGEDFSFTNRVCLEWVDYRLKISPSDALVLYYC